MGATHVTVTIRNPADPDRHWEGLFRVDTGAFDSLVPSPHLDAIGLKPEGKRVYELADGNEIVMGITIADIEFMGESSRPGEFHPEALPEPCVNLSAHTAPPMQPYDRQRANVRTG